MTRRTERVNDLLREEISDLIRKQLKDPRLGGLVTVTEVVTSPDLHFAKVFISVMGTEEERQATMKALNAARGYLRRELRSRLSMKYIPELNFLYDISIERGARVLALLKEVASENESPKEQE